MSDIPKFDFSFLNKISGGDQQFILEMVNTFKELVPDFIGNSQRFLEENNYEALSREAHKFLPGVSFLGIKNLEDKLSKIEEYSKKNIDLDKIPELLDSSIKEINEIVTIFNSEFNLE